MRFASFPKIKRVKGGRPDDNWEQEIWRIFCDELSKGCPKKEMAEFLTSIFPKNERQKIVKRIVAEQRLREGYKYMEIENELGISPQTISVIKEASLAQNYKGYNILFYDSRVKNAERKWKAVERRKDKEANSPRPMRRYGKGKMRDFL
ncbi:MAG: Trp family transcriptional regulator [bacterium]|nr:Trp family transcriptional regulator [bacterium]